MKYILAICSIPFVIPYVVVSGIVTGVARASHRVSETFYFPDLKKDEDNSDDSGT